MNCRSAQSAPSPIPRTTDPILGPLPGRGTTLGIHHRVATWLIGSLLLAGAVGCQKDNTQRDSYIRELRIHEDQIYEMQDYMTEYQHLLREQRKDNARLRKQLAEQSGASPTTLSEEDDDTERSLLDLPAKRNENDKPSAEPIEQIDLPEIDLGEPTMPEIDLGEPVPGGELEPMPSGELDELSQAADDTQAQLASTGTDAGLASDDVETALFAPLTQPTETANSCVVYAEQIPLESANDAGQLNVGLMAIVEPLTADGGAGYFMGELSLMLVDPLASDEQWEISRWDYTPEEVDLSWRDNSRRVLDLPLALPAGTPTSRPLELWVRLVDKEQGTKILCSTAVTLNNAVGLSGSPVSGGDGSNPGAVVTTGWTTADKLDPAQASNRSERPASWKASAELPPQAIAQAEPQPLEPRSKEPQPAPSRKNIAERGPGWSPFR